jgi:hypothetical protein
MKYIERVIGLPALYEIEARTVFRNQPEQSEKKSGH